MTKQSYEILVNGVQVRAEYLSNVEPCGADSLSDAYGRVRAFAAAIDNALAVLKTVARITAQITTDDVFDGETPVTRTVTYEYRRQTGMMVEA